MIFKIDSHNILHNKKMVGDLLIEKGKLTYLSGENGIGKTSLLNYLLKSQNDLLKCKVILIDQLPLSPLDSYRAIDLFKTISEELPEKTIESLSDYLEKLPPEIKKYLDYPFMKLSGGQKQLVKILLNFYLKGDLYLLDEPTQYLDEKNRKFLIDLIKKKLNEEKTILIVDHHPEVFKSMTSIWLHLKITGDVVELVQNGI